MLTLNRGRSALYDGTGRRFDPARRSWSPPGGQAGGEPISRLDAVRWLQRESGRPCRVPVGVVGSRRAGADETRPAEELGAIMADLGLTVLCGGRGGVMEAVCRGVERGGGLSIGLLPGDAPDSANPHVTVPLATGIGVARNALIARAALCLIAFGGGYGTISEMAFGLQFGRPVFALPGAPELAGATFVADAGAAAAAVAGAVLGLDRPSSEP